MAGFMLTSGQFYSSNLHFKVAKTYALIFSVNQEIWNQVDKVLVTSIPSGKRFGTQNGNKAYLSS